MTHKKLSTFSLIITLSMFTQISPLTKTTAVGIALITGTTAGIITKMIVKESHTSPYHRYDHDNFIPTRGNVSLFVDGEISKVTASGIVAGATTAILTYLILYHCYVIPAVEAPIELIQDIKN